MSVGYGKTTRPTIKIFNNNKCVIHLICYGSNYSDSDTDSYYDTDSSSDSGMNSLRYEEASTIQQIQMMTEHITKKYPDLWLMMKRGDLIENTSESGYRSEGRFYIDKSDNKITNNLSINQLYTKYDDYGSIPPHFCTIRDFPIGYFDECNIITNNSFVPNETKQSEWHCLEGSPMFFDTKRLKLNTVTRDDIFIDHFEDDENNYIFAYVILKYRKINYCFLLDDSHEKTEKNTYNIEKITDDLVDYMLTIFAKPFFVTEYMYMSYTDAIVQKIKSEHHVDEKNFIDIREP